MHNDRLHAATKPSSFPLLRMYTILHISDLHRTPGHHVTNDELISALIRDRAAYTGSVRPIRAPDAIVVSGDIVQGVPLGTANSASVLRAQYDEALKFLTELTDRFLAGDRSRVVIVPGNHDIDWNVAKAAMRLVEAEKAPKDLPQALYELDSIYRWSWKTRELFEVYDQEAYGKRLDAFWDFFEKFYCESSGPRSRAVTVLAALPISCF